MGSCQQFGLEAERFAVASQFCRPCALTEKKSRKIDKIALFSIRQLYFQLETMVLRLGQHPKPKNEASGVVCAQLRASERMSAKLSVAKN